MSLMRKVDSSIPQKPESFTCTACLLYKSKHKTPKPTDKRASKKFDLIHSDLSGRFSVRSLGGKEYYISFIDDHTRYAWICFLKNKSDAAGTIKKFLRMIKTQFDTTIKVLQTDNGGEYANSDVENFLMEMGIVIKNSPAYSHESNGTAERFNQTIITNARTMLMDHGKFLWVEAISMAVYLCNRLPHRSINGQTPIEVLIGHTPSLTNHLRRFGTMPRALTGILVGYTDSAKIFRIYIPSKCSVVISRQVLFPDSRRGEIFLENDLPTQKPSTIAPITPNVILPSSSYPSNNTTDFSSKREDKILILIYPHLQQQLYQHLNHQILLRILTCLVHFLICLHLRVPLKYRPDFKMLNYLLLSLHTRKG